MTWSRASRRDDHAAPAMADETFYLIVTDHDRGLFAVEGADDR
jgi:hypothetical protein